MYERHCGNLVKNPFNRPHTPLVSAHVCVIPQSIFSMVELSSKCRKYGVTRIRHDTFFQLVSKLRKQLTFESWTGTRFGAGVSVSCARLPNVLSDYMSVSHDLRALSDVSCIFGEKSALCSCATCCGRLRRLKKKPHCQRGRPSMCLKNSNQKVATTFTNRNTPTNVFAMLPRPRFLHANCDTLPF